MIGESDGRSTILGAPAAEVVDPAGAVEQRVLRMDVKMNELAQPIQTLNKRYLNFYRCLT